MMRDVGRGDGGGDGGEDRRPRHPPLPNDGVPAAPHFEDTDFKPTSPRRNLVLPDPYKNPSDDSSDEDDEPPMNRRRIAPPPDPSPEKLSRNPGTPDPDEPCSSKNMYGNQQQRNSGASSARRGSPIGDAEEQLQGMEAAESAAVAALVAGPTRGLTMGQRTNDIRRMKENGRVIQPPKLTKREWAAEYFSVNLRASQQPREPSPAPSPSPPPAPEDPEAARRAREEEEERMVRENFDEEGNVREEALVFHAVPEERLSSEEVEHRQEEQDEVVPGGGSDGEEPARQEPEEDEDVQEEIESISEYDEYLEIPDVQGGESGRSSRSSSTSSESGPEELHNQIIEQEEQIESEPEVDPIPAPAAVNNEETSSDDHLEDMSGFAHHPNYQSLSDEDTGEENAKEAEAKEGEVQAQQPEEPQQPSSSQQPAPRGRGRPKKNATQPAQPAAAGDQPPRGRPVRKRANSPSPSSSRSRSNNSAHRRLPRRPPNVAAKRPKTKEDSAPNTSPSISPFGRKKGLQDNEDSDGTPLSGASPVGKRHHMPIKSDLSGKYWEQAAVAEEGGRALRDRKKPTVQKSAPKPVKKGKRGRKPGKLTAAAPAPAISSTVPSTVPATVPATALYNPPPLQLSRLCAGCRKQPAQAIPAADTGNTGTGSATAGNDDGKADFFIVEKILGHKRTKEGHFYLIKWLGYDDSHNSWEPTSSIIEAASDSGLLFLQQQYDKLAKISTPAEEWTVFPAALRARQENMASRGVLGPGRKKISTGKDTVASPGPATTGPTTRGSDQTAKSSFVGKSAAKGPAKKISKATVARPKAGRPKKATVIAARPEAPKKYGLRTRSGH